MITLAQALSDIVKQTPFLEEGLATGIINLSGLARKLKPKIEKRLYKRPTTAAMIMALKRLRPKVKPGQKGLAELKKLRGLTVRSNLTEYVFYNFPGIIPLQKQLMQKLEGDKELFLNLSQGISETTLIISSSLERKVESVIPKKVLVAKIENLSAITLRLHPEHLYAVGVCYNLFKSLAWENINFLETITGYSEISVIVEQKDSDRAFSCIKSLTE